ncbi:MAG: hypothetical protein WDZ72_02535 [Cyclobacteriaceae bacterium]
MKNKIIFTLMLIPSAFSACHEKAISHYLQKKEGLVAFWDFKEESRSQRKAIGVADFPLHEMNGPVRRADEGPISGYSAVLKNEVYFSIENAAAGALNIKGKNQGITLLAWVKWEGKTGFVGGMWNEYTEGGRRQFGLFVDLPHYNGADQVCGHISYSGGPTPLFHIVVIILPVNKCCKRGGGILLLSIMMENISNRTWMASLRKENRSRSGIPLVLTAYRRG